MTLLSILLIGFLLGVKHALDSDHLAAVATLATGQHSMAASLRQGLAWGLGHTFTLLVVGGSVLLLGATIPKQLEQALELAVGAMLVLLGVDVVRRAIRQRIHLHVHRHGNGQRHVHAHSHATERLARWPQIGAAAHELPRLKLDHAMQCHDHIHPLGLPFRALAVGMMHGLAGSAALVVLSLQTAQSLPVGLGYIVVFGIGSIVGMGLLSVVIAVPLRWSGLQLTGMYRGLVTAVGVATLSLGLWVVYRIGIVEGLLI